MKKNKKGILNNVQTLVIGLVGLSLIAVIGLLILAQLGQNTQIAADGNASGAVGVVTSAASDTVDWVPLIVLATVGGLLLALVMYFRGGA